MSTRDDMASAEAELLWAAERWVDGSLGRARVHARRAAGHAIRAALSGAGRPSLMDHIAWLADHDGVDAALSEAAARLAARPAPASGWAGSPATPIEDTEAIVEWCRSPEPSALPGGPPVGRPTPVEAPDPGLATQLEPAAFVCRHCDRELTMPVFALPIFPEDGYEFFELEGAESQPLVPRGTFVTMRVDEFLEIPPGMFIVHPEDLLGVRQDASAGSGCCGNSDPRVNTLFCVNRTTKDWRSEEPPHPLGTLIDDCWTPHYAWLQPEAVRRAASPRTVGVGAVGFGLRTCTRAEDLFDFLHGAFPVDEWFGHETFRLLARVQRNLRQPTVLVWYDAAGSRLAGVPVDDIAAAFGALEDHRPGLRLELI